MVAGLLTGFFVLAALVHIYWAAGGRRGMTAAIPSVDGKPLFTPSPLATAMVAVAMLIMALLVQWQIQMVQLPIPQSWARLVLLALAAIFALRAVGDFKYTGFFKRVRNSAFAKLDTRFYSPLCLAIAGGLWLISRT
ncbi:DUF3995 domain-containing protein [Andreprevotia chitinilytica]|uniref:DUF3995 domain-containing protein n=1 Tax=Andreprevotia chitinilytica TaxID=396808 RepID=UPI000558DC28|nr:DUF3995 domain-containing protein [Andreprevotia chitinilytica]